MHNSCRISSQLAFSSLFPVSKFYFSQFPNYGSSRANQRGWCVGRGPTPNEVGRWEQHRSLRVGLRYQVDASLLRHCHPFHRTRSSLGLSLLLGQLFRRRMEASTHLPIPQHHPSHPPRRTSIRRVTHLFPFPFMFSLFHYFFLYAYVLINFTIFLSRITFWNVHFHRPA